MSEKLVEIRSLSVKLDGKTILENVNMDVNRDDFIGVIGPNGGGKTTLVKAILGLISPSQGRISYFFRKKDGQNPIGYLPQIHEFDRTFPITVQKVVLSGLGYEYGLLRRPNAADKRKVNALLDRMGIAHLRKKPIGALSGGEMQRVFLCRAVISGPELLILDEPNTFVDNRFEAVLYDYLKVLQKDMAIILVSHDIGTISYYIKTIACVNRKVHYHPSNIITEQQLEAYECPLQIITHGHVPHTVLKAHDKTDD